MLPSAVLSLYLTIFTTFPIESSSTPSQNMGSTASVPQSQSQVSRRTVQVTPDRREQDLNEKFSSFKVTEDYERDGMVAGRSPGI